jgi:hypothetical protein
MDLITVVNLLNAAWLESTDTWDWFDFWESLGAFRSDISHYGDVAKVVNDVCKKYPTRGFPALRVAECGVMTGYRNPPFPGFDRVEETRKLADGGEPHGLKRMRGIEEFRKIADEILDIPGDTVPWMSFEDYVVSGEWETTGSSSVGRVEWEFEGEAGKSFKAKKNLVPDVYDLRDLAWESVEEVEQENRSLEKSELGKIRIAVAGDIYTYLKMAWLMRFCGGSYLNWLGNTLAEDAVQQTDRMIAMLQAIVKAWNLPFDYRGFDHQPQTVELQAILTVLFRVGRRNVPVGHTAEFDTLVTNVLGSFDAATLSCRDDKGQRHAFRVKGGLQSGLFVTSVIGNGWNSVITESVVRALTGMGVSMDRIGRWIRGDDSALVFDTYAAALLFREGYAAVGADAADGKFGIHEGKSEFLRVWYDADGCHGYPSRAIPGLQQRKPWTSAPWEDESTMAHVYDTVRTLRRRGLDPGRVDAWWAATKLVWSQRKHVSQDWLQIPKSMGGLGIEPWDGRTYSGERWPSVPTRNLRVTNQTGWRAAKILDAYSSWLPVSVVESSQLADALTAAKVATDDVPAVNSAFRKMARVPVGPSTIRRLSDAPWNIPAVNTLKGVAAWLSSLPAAVGVLASALGTCAVGAMGSYSWLAQKWSDVGDVWRLRGKRNVLAWFRVHYPEFWLAVRSLERRGLARWEALDWLFGTVSINVVYALHPTMSELLRRATAQVINGYLSRSRLQPRQMTQLASTTSRVLETSLRSSELVRQVYAW